MGHTPAPPGKPLRTRLLHRKVPEHLLKRSAELYLYCSTCGCNTIWDFIHYFVQNLYVLCCSGWFFFSLSRQIGNPFLCLICPAAICYNQLPWVKALFGRTISQRNQLRFCLKLCRRHLVIHNSLFLVKWPSPPNYSFSFFNYCTQFTA